MNIKLIAAIVIALFGAIFIGVGAASDQLQTIAIVMGAATVGVCLMMGRNIWMLIPLTTYVQLTLKLPSQPSTLLVGQLLMSVFGILMIATGKQPIRWRMTSLEWVMVIFLLCVLQVYLRNPVGISVLGGGSVGGKAYILFAVAFVAAVILAIIKVPYDDLKKVFRLTIIGGLINFFVSIFGYFVPVFGQYFGVGTVEQTYGLEAVDSERASRLAFAKRIGVNIALWISSMMDPLKACFKALWLPLVLFAFVAAGLSGYRNVIAATGLTFLLGIMYHGGIRSLFVSVSAGAIALMIVAVINASNPLPPNIQRAMSFLPGTWDEEYKEDAANSTAWRVEMWEEALLTDNWINNKIIGDGLGFTAEELAYQAELRFGGFVGGDFGGFDAQRLSFLVSGDYHSGPVSAVRTIGYVGLVVMWICMIMIAVRAHRLIRRSRKRRWRHVVMIVCIPLVWYPIFFTFIFGLFAKDSVIILMGFGMVRLLENNIPWDEDEMAQLNTEAQVE